MIREKLKELLEVTEFVYFDTSLDWHTHYTCEFYRFFNYNDTYEKTGSIFAFLSMLGNWYTKSSFAFKADTGKSFEDCFHKIEDYLQAFLAHSNSIQNEFPIMYRSISYLLDQLDSEEKFETRFPHVDQTLFQNMRDELSIPLYDKGFNIDKIFKEVHFSLLKEE
ncbi:hypothetical protein SFC65_24690 [Priestia filamentosa]|uniref:hypothetical protein n=1 Tax=Priestia filamentosa TaxID=1402861 RepID=UPI003981FBAD